MVAHCICLRCQKCALVGAAATLNSDPVLSKLTGKPLWVTLCYDHSFIQEVASNAVLAKSPALSRKDAWVRSPLNS